MTSWIEVVGWLKFCEENSDNVDEEEEIQLKLNII